MMLELVELIQVTILFIAPALTNDVYYRWEKDSLGIGLFPSAIITIIHWALVYGVKTPNRRLCNAVRVN